MRRICRVVKSLCNNPLSENNKRRRHADNVTTGRWQSGKASALPHRAANVRLPTRIDRLGLRYLPRTRNTPSRTPQSTWQSLALFFFFSLLWSRLAPSSYLAAAFWVNLPQRWKWQLNSFDFAALKVNTRLKLIFSIKIKIIFIIMIILIISTVIHSPI